MKVGSYDSAHTILTFPVIGTRYSIPRLLCPGIFSAQNQVPHTQTTGHNPNETAYKVPITTD